MVNCIKARPWAIRLMVCVVAINGWFTHGSLSAIAAPDFAETVQDVQPGANSFRANAGNVITIRVQNSPENRTCHPEILPSEGLQVLGRIERHTDDQGIVLQIAQDGTYHYGLPTTLDSTGSCVITIGPSNRYEQLLVEATDLRRQSYAYFHPEELGEPPMERPQFVDLRQQALDLYQQAITLEPQYPAPYQQSIAALYDIHMPPDFFQTADSLEDFGAQILSWPEPARTQISSDYSTLAQIYETSPEWVVGAPDTAQIMREFAEFARTGTPSATLKAFFEDIDTDDD